MSPVRIGFHIDTVRAVPGGWRLDGEPAYHPRHRPRVGERFTVATDDADRHPRPVDLVVVEISATHAVVRGAGSLNDHDVVRGERPEPLEPLPPRPLADILGRAPAAPEPRAWSPVEARLGVTLPADFKAFVDAHGAGQIDGHLTVCAPDEPHEWRDLLQNQRHAMECVRLDFCGPGNYAKPWPVGDPTHWTPGHGGIPPWFEPGHDLISWGHTDNGDLLLWHLTPGTPPDDWPVVLKEEGPYWERFAAGFEATLRGLLTGDLQSEYLSRPLGGLHTYVF